MKKFKLLVFVLMMASLAFPTKVGTLAEVMKPDNITVYGNELYVVEGAEISVYSLDDLSLVRKFGKKGDGPGELKVLPGFYNKISVFPGYILLVSFDRFVFFSKEGTFLKEKKKSFLISQILPVGKNFVVKKLTIGDDGITYSVIALYNSEMEKIKELYRQKFVQQGALGSVKLDMVMDFVSVKVYDDNIFVDASSKGFIIEAFDSQGKNLYQISKEYEKIKVTDDHKKEIIERFKEDPVIKFQMQNHGGWEGVKKLFTMKFQDTFPAIKNLEIFGEKLYVQTFKVKENKSENIIMDLKGKIIKTVYLARFENTPMLAQILGAKLHTLYNDKLYYLLENEDEEEWELHVEEIR